MDLIGIIELIITGGVGAACIKLMETVLVWALNRKTGNKDREAAKQQEMAAAIHTLKTAQRVILHDRIKFLGKGHLAKGYVDLDDRKDLVEMQQLYHNELGGNGNLDHLMKAVMKLPVK